MNCQFYDRGAYHECTESQAEWVRDKEEGNFCSYFRPTLDQAHQRTDLSQAKQDLNSLFNSDSDEKSEPTTNPMDPLNNLFKK